MSVGQSMQAILIKQFVKSLDDVVPSTIPIPWPPRDIEEPQYLVKVAYTSPTHVDTLYAQGLHQNNNRKRGHVHPPFVLGNEFSGTILETCSSSQSASATSCRFKTGDKVWGTWLGSFATHIVVPEPALQLLPQGVSLHDAAAIGASAAPVSYGALFQIAKLKVNETCLVHAAAGGLGIVAVQMALAAGANVICTVSSDKKVKAIQDLLEKADPQRNGVVKYSQPGWEDQVKGLSQGRGVDVVFDTVGLVEKSIRCCAFNARVIVIGFVGRNGKMEKVAMNRVLLKQIQLLGYRYGETSRQMPEVNIQTWKGLNDMLNRGAIRPIVHQEYSGLASISQALKLMTTREVVGRVVVDVGCENEHESSERATARVSKL